MYNDISPEILVTAGVILGILFVAMVLRLCCDVHVLRKGRKELDCRIKSLRLNKMIERLNIRHEKYLQKTSDLDKERHIWACEHCPEPEVCDHMFEGEDIDPHFFCPNIEELEEIKKGHKPTMH